MYGQHRYEINWKQGDLSINLSSDDLYFISKQMDRWCQILMDDSYVPISMASSAVKKPTPTVSNSPALSPQPAYVHPEAPAYGAPPQPPYPVPQPAYAAAGERRLPKKPRFLIISVTSGGTICSHALSPVCNFARASGG